MESAISDVTVRRQARLALTQFGIRHARLTRLAHRHNDVYRVDAPARERFVLRIQNDLLSDAQAESQLKWLGSLSTQPGLVVPKPVRTIDDQPFTFIHTSSGSRQRAVLLRWVPGQLAKKRDASTFLAAAGMIAQMHTHAQTFHAGRGFACRELDGDWLFGPRFFARMAASKARLNPSQRRLAGAAERFVRTAMESLGRSPRRFGIIHADTNLDNIVFYHGQPAPIDFDEFGKGWYLFDLAELIRTSINSRNWAERKQLALEWYTQTRQISNAEHAAFDAFIVATFMQYLNWTFLHSRTPDDLKWVGFCLDVVRNIIKQ